MQDLLHLTKEQLRDELFAWITILAMTWIGSSWICKAVAALLWQLYDLFIGKPP